MEEMPIDHRDQYLLDLERTLVMSLLYERSLLTDQEKAEKEARRGVNNTGFPDNGSPNPQLDQATACTSPGYNDGSVYNDRPAYNGHAYNITDINIIGNNGSSLIQLQQPTGPVQSIDPTLYPVHLDSIYNTGGISNFLNLGTKNSIVRP